MSSQRVVLVAGALGVVGRAALAHFQERGDSRVIGLSRRAPDFPTSAQWLRVDLTDAAATAEALRAVPDVTHLVYTALYEEPELVSGWTGDRQIRINLEMLQNLVEPLQRHAPGLRHVTLLQGTKAYGIHHGPFPIPAKESDPRFIAPNFYYDQEDWLRAQAATAEWDITVLRPQLVCGHAIGNPMNAVAAWVSMPASRGSLACRCASRAGSPASSRRWMQGCWPAPSPGPARNRVAVARSTTSPMAMNSPGPGCGVPSPMLSA
ncbi:NAD-dependent epimerase/dehydratase family protein [Pseudoroseomonas wenyumeiae]|uniref:NAD-dependent epimerase/dehydratase family protein n=1 Tax=Teichococcus wenyumeiae TaxID=2478470 RepID=A0A3A9JPV9_9PROT|nr:NAD-dependent epimerase/dehydratase family protein [Pseudoroseomonas wenyumeiae]RKK05926.1 NAD-dependent epimerase/dehydratase family protein [Pseudoroseomonas wenyumeiae]RMI19850.1 NAD-dependent epimerase/dehydratase family protein [Pseudoroseomonas wenyumeiae]